MSNPELSQNLTFDRREVISGYSLRYNGLRSVQGDIKSFTDSLQQVTFELSPINWYANKTALNMSIQMDAASATQNNYSFLNCLMKIPPIDRIRISSRSSKTAIEIPQVFRMGCMKYFKKKGERPGDLYSFATTTEFSMSTDVDPNRKIFHFSWLLADILGAFFNTKNVIPLTEVLQIEITFCPKNVIAYSFAKYSNTNNADDTLSAGSVGYKNSIYYRGYPTLDTAGKPVLPTVAGVDRLGAEVIAPFNGDLTITNCSLVYEQERNPLVDISLKAAVTSGRLMSLPYINCVPTSQSFNNQSNSYTMSLRLTNNVGTKLKRIVFTAGLADDKESLYKLGTYNTSSFGSAKIKTVYFDIGGRNIAQYGVQNYDHLNTREFDFSFDNQIDRILEDIPNVANAVGTDASLGLNPGRFRALPKNTFMIDIPFETVSDSQEELFSSNSGVDLSGDEVLNIRMELDRTLDAGLSGVKMTCFLYGIKFMRIEPSLMDFI